MHLTLKKLFVNALCFAQTLSYLSDIRQPSRLSTDNAKFKQIYNEHRARPCIHVIYVNK